MPFLPPPSTTDNKRVRTNPHQPWPTQPWLRFQPVRVDHYSSGADSLVGLVSRAFRHGRGDPAPLRRELRTLRLERGWTQEALSRHSGLAVVQVSRIERGKREVRLGTILQLLNALDVEPNDLLRGF